MDSRALAPSTPPSFASSRPCPRGSKLLAATKRSRTNGRGDRARTPRLHPTTSRFRRGVTSRRLWPVTALRKAPDGTPMPIHDPVRTPGNPEHGRTDRKWPSNCRAHPESPTGRPNPKSTATGQLGFSQHTKREVPWLPAPPRAPWRIRGRKTPTLAGPSGDRRLPKPSRPMYPRPHLPNDWQPLHSRRRASKSSLNLEAPAATPMNLSAVSLPRQKHLSEIH